ncbi:hypothetical protein D3C76_607670 [compost metagenome]
MPLLATTVQAHRGLEGLGRIGIGSEDKKLKLGGHHRCQANGCVTRDDCLELASGRQIGAFARQLVRITDGQCPRVIAPGQAVDLRRIRHQREVAVIATVKTRRRISAHDALQHHTPCQLQTTSFQEALGRHYFAPWYAIQVRRDAFDLINAGQSLRE